MNQILITEKLYVTPELRRKKKIYKANFVLSVFLVCILFSFYIYAEYDRNKNEEVSQEILSSLEIGNTENEEADVRSLVELNLQTDDTTIRVEDNVLIVVLNETGSNRQEIDVTKIARDAQQYIEQVQDQPETPTKQEVYKTSDGRDYTTESILNIPSLGINYPVLKHTEYPYTTDELLKISLTKFWGGQPNEIGNYVIVGHNYKNKKMFGKLAEIKIGDRIELTDLKGRKITYEVYDKYKVAPEDTACTSQKTRWTKRSNINNMYKLWNTKISSKNKRSKIKKLHF